MTEVSEIEAPAKGSRYRSRKFILAVAAVASATALVAFGRIDGTVYSTVMLAALSAYSIANVAQKATAKASA